MSIKIIERSRFTVVGLRYRGKNEQGEIPQLWRDLGPRSGEIQNMVDNTAAYGISANIDKETGAFDYIAGFEVSSAEAVPEGMVAFDVPDGRYAVVSTTLPQIGEAFDQAHHTLLPQAGHQPSGGPEFELYDERFDSEDPTSEFDLYIPIK